MDEKIQQLQKKMKLLFDEYVKPVGSITLFSTVLILLGGFIFFSFLSLFILVGSFLLGLVLLAFIYFGFIGLYEFITQYLNNKKEK